MRLLAVADLHYSLPQYDWVVSVAEEFDVVIVAGDHLDLSSMVDFRAQVVVVRKYLDRLKTKAQLLTCSGNHDLDSRNAAGEKVARWIRDLGRHRRAGRRPVAVARRHAVHDVRLVGRAGGARRDRRAASRRGAGTARRNGSGSITRRRTRARPVGAAAGPSATPSWRSGSPNTSRTSSFPAMSTSRPSSRTAPGPTGSAIPGSSTPATSSARRRPTSSSIPTIRRRCGFPPPAARWCASTSRS